MPGWLLSLLSLFEKPVIRWALAYLETKYPGLAPVIEQIIKWLEGQHAAGNYNATQTLSNHVDKICMGTCPPNLKND